MLILMQMSMFETSPIAHPRSCLIGTSLPIDSRLTAKFPAILTHQSFHLTCFIVISEYIAFEDFLAFSFRKGKGTSYFGKIYEEKGTFALPKYSN